MMMRLTRLPSSIAMRVATRTLSRSAAAVAPVRRTLSRPAAAAPIRRTLATYGSGTSSVGSSLPGGLTAPSAGRAFLGGSGILGMGALCWYGTGMSPYMSTVEEAALWPAYVRQRVSSTYAWFGLGLGLTAAQTTLLFRSGAAHRMMTLSPMVSLIGGVGAMFASQMLVRSIATDATIPKALAFSVFTGTVSLVISPIMFLGGTVVTQAAAYTGIVCAGITALAYVAPSDEFLSMGGPLMAGLGILVVTSLGSMFFPAAAAAGGVLHTIQLYGGTVLFAGLMLYDTQSIVARAKTAAVFDPAAESMRIYMDAINLFIRIATMLSGGGQKKK